MKTMRISAFDDNIKDGFFLTSKDRYRPAICKVSNFRFHDTDPLLQLSIDWINKGNYTNGQLKKLVTRTLVRSLSRMMRYEVQKRLHTKERNV